MTTSDTNLTPTAVHSPSGDQQGPAWMLTVGLTQDPSCFLKRLIVTWKNVHSAGMIEEG